MKRTILFVVVFFTLALPCLANTEEEATPERPWSDSAEFSWVLIGGNAESSTIGFKNLYQYKWSNALFTLKTGAIRAESTIYTRFALGSPGDFSIIEQKDTKKTAEHYYINGQYDGNISKTFFWFAGAGWYRNEFSGIRNRYSTFGGVGNIWVDSERIKFKTDYGLQYTDETPVFEPEDYDGSYVSLRLSYNYFQKIFQFSEFNQDFEWIANLEEPSDFRANLLNSFTTALNHFLSLKIGLDLLYNNEPAYAGVPLFDDTMTQIGTVPYQLDELDYNFTTALVVTFK